MRRGALDAELCERGGGVALRRLDRRAQQADEEVEAARRHNVRLGSGEGEGEGEG